jgi:hypothetical protein
MSSRRLFHTRRIVLAGLLSAIHHCHGGCINLYYQNVIPKPYTKWYHKFYYILVWVSMEILYSTFIGIISSMIARKIDGIGLQCRRDNLIKEDFIRKGGAVASLTARAATVPIASAFRALSSRPTVSITTGSANEGSAGSGPVRRQEMQAQAPPSRWKAH